MDDRFKDILAEEMGFPTTQELRRRKDEWYELEQAIYEIDNNYNYGYGYIYGISIDDIVGAYSMIANAGYTPNTLLMHPETAQDLLAWNSITIGTGIIPEQSNPLEGIFEGKLDGNI